MSIHIVVDGYNFIRRSRHLRALDRQDLQLGREALQDLLAAYQKTKGHRITVVFDNQTAFLDTAERFQAKGIQFIFSQRGRSADDVIKKIASKEKEKAVVVTSDGEVISFCTSQGATVIRSEAFEDTVYRAVHALGEGGVKDEIKAERRAGTNKKGPGKRLSKKERQARRKTAKL